MIVIILFHNFTLSQTETPAFAIICQYKYNCYRNQWKPSLENFFYEKSVLKKKNKTFNKDAWIDDISDNLIFAENGVKSKFSIISFSV